eukprot:g15500.t1
MDKLYKTKKDQPRPVPQRKKTEEKDGVSLPPRAMRFLRNLSEMYLLNQIRAGQQMKTRVKAGKALADQITRSENGAGASSVADGFVLNRGYVDDEEDDESDDSEGSEEDVDLFQVGIDDDIQMEEDVEFYEDNVKGRNLGAMLKSVIDNETTASTSEADVKEFLALLEKQKQ